jgi:hypothetical protein
MFISHTGYGGVAYAMAISCLRLSADAKFETEHTAEMHFVSTSQAAETSSACEDLADNSKDAAGFRQGDYRDILSLTRVLVHGPKSKEEVDFIIDRYVLSCLIK